MRFKQSILNQKEVKHILTKHFESNEVKRNILNEKKVNEFQTKHFESKGSETYSNKAF